MCTGSRFATARWSTLRSTVSCTLCTASQLLAVLLRIPQSVNVLDNIALRAFCLFISPGVREDNLDLVDNLLSSTKVKQPIEIMVF